MASNTATYTTVMEVSTYVTCTILIVSLCFTIVRVCTGSKVAFLIYLMTLLIVANLSYIVYMTLYNDRHRLEKYATEYGTEERQQLLNIVTAAMSLDFLHYACLNCAIWCFCFKYWVVSVEVSASLRAS